MVSPRSAGQAAGPAYAKRFGRAGNPQLRHPATSQTQTMWATAQEKTTDNLEQNKIELSGLTLTKNK